MLHFFSIPYLSHAFFTASYKAPPYHLTEGNEHEYSYLVAL